MSIAFPGVVQILSQSTGAGEYIKDLGFYPGPGKPQRRFSWEGKPPGTPHLGVLLLLPVCPSQTKLSMPWTECVSPKSMLKPSSHGDGIREWGIGTTIRLDEVMSMKLPRGDQCLHNKEAPGLCSLRVREQQKGRHLMPGKGFSPKNKSADTLLLDFPTSRTERNKC